MAASRSGLRHEGDRTAVTPMPVPTVVSAILAAVDGYSTVSDPTNDSARFSSSNPSPDAYWEYETPLWQRQQQHERREAASVAALQAIVAEEVIADAAAVADKQEKRWQQQHEDEPPLWQRQRQHEQREAASVAALQAIVADEVIADAVVL